MNSLSTAKYTAFVGLDWADAKHDICLQAAGSDGATHVLFEPLDFMYRMYGMPRAQGCAGAAISKLAALVPKPRVHLIIL